MHTYFVPVKEWGHAKTRKSEKLLQLWRVEWERAGFAVKVLNESYARAHSRYRKFNRLIEAFPLGANREYDRSCFMRHLAMVSAGGGWMSDYDTMPLRLRATSNEMPFGGAYTVYEHSVPSLVSGNAFEWNRVAWLLARSSYPPRSTLWSDMMALQALHGNYVSKMLVLGTGVRGHALLIPQTPNLCDSTQHYYAAHFSHYAFGTSGLTAEDRAPRIATALLRWKNACPSAASIPVAASKYVVFDTP